MLGIKDRKPTGEDPTRELSAQENWCRQEGCAEIAEVGELEGWPRLTDRKLGLIPSGTFLT